MHRILLTIAIIVSLACCCGGAADARPSRMAGVPLPAPELADGSVSVRLMREQLGNNIAGHPVTLKVGGTQEVAETDAQGRARLHRPHPWNNRASRSRRRRRDPAVAGIRGSRARAASASRSSPDSRPSPRVSARQRKRAPSEPPRPGIVMFGGESRIITEFQDDNLQVFYILDIVNGARTPIDDRRAPRHRAAARGDKRHNHGGFVAPCQRQRAIRDRDGAVSAGDDARADRLHPAVLQRDA